MSAAGPPQGRLHERGEAKARSARPRELAAADTWLLHFVQPYKEAARNCAAAAWATEAASVGVHQ
jgi:hypothetical protein